VGTGQGALEGLGMNPQFWRGKRVFLTGHTGFKGGWMSLWLQHLGAKVTGFALQPPTKPCLFEVASVGHGMHSVIGDVRDSDLLRQLMQEARPEIVIHMAAQPLVRYSYVNPAETYATNVMGTVNVLEAVKATPSVHATVNVTTDKCYENREWVWGYRENEALGGYDPYSSSKACSELVSAAYRQSYQLNLATARAGNVIGGGDCASDRLIPDMVRAFESQQSVLIRHPNATRPWQHVLEPVRGYLTLAEQLYKRGSEVATSFNFGPRDQDVQPVAWIVAEMVAKWGNGASWHLDKDVQLHEANSLRLDCSKAQAELGWSPSWALENSLGAVVAWHKSYQGKADMRQVCLDQIGAYILDTETLKQKANAKQQNQ